MKRILLIVSLFMGAIMASEAQDVIAHKDGNVTLGKVVEIGPETIKYRKADNPDGPVYILKRSDLLSVRFENGTQEIFSAATQMAALQPLETVVLDDDDDSEENYSHIVCPEVRLSLDIPLNDDLDGGGGVMGVCGFQMNDYFMFGPGFGILGHKYLNHNASSIEMPVFVQARILFNKKPISPYLIGQLGYTFGFLDEHGSALWDNHDDTKKMGLFGAAGLGIKIRMKRGSLFFDARLNAQTNTSSVVGTSNALCISGGYIFGHH